MEMDRARREEYTRAKRMWDASQEPLATGVVPNPATASMFHVESLTGETIPIQNFTHNNMQPFFGSRVKQNMRDDVYSSRLEAFTGRSELFQNKQEIEPMFKPQAGFTNICGLKNANDFYQDRIEKPKVQNNVFPIEQVHVGPGLGMGYSAQPTGGFQQADTLDYIKPKTVDELRVGNRVKTTYEAGPQGPMQGPSQRGSIGEVVKRLPDTFYEQTPDHLLRTTGAYTGNTPRSVPIVRDTARTDSHIDYVGAAGPSAQHTGDSRDSQYTAPCPQQLPSLPSGPQVQTLIGQGVCDDYGKASIEVYNTERAITSTRTVVANVTSTVKAMIAPILDIFRHTPKEYTLDASRTYGSLQPTFPAKATLYDPVQYSPKTTIKETTIHDTTIMNLKGSEQGRREDPNAPETTLRDTLPIHDGTRNIRSGKYRVVVYNPDLVAKTTVRETTEQPREFGNPTDSAIGAYVYIEVEAPATQKQFVSDHDYIGGVSKGSQDGYRVVQYTYVPKTTQKQHVSNHHHYGTAASQAEHRPISSDMARTFKNRASKEALEANRMPTASGPKQSPNKGYVSSIYSSKPIEQEVASRNAGNVDRIYSQGATQDQCQVTKNRQNLEDPSCNRLDPALLAPFRSNPYTQSLSSVA